MPERDLPEGFSGARSTAEQFARDPQKAAYLLHEALQKAERNRGVLESVWADLQALFRLVRAWVNRDYPRLPWQTIVFALASVVYFVNPFDVVPDFLPGAGFLDDATVIGFVIRSIKHDIEQFLDWERAQVVATKTRETQ